MFVSSSRLFILLDGPFSLFHHQPSTILRFPHGHSLTSPLPPLSAVPHHLLPPSRSKSPFLIKSSQQFQSQSANDTLQEKDHVPDDAYLVPPSHPWPEWSELLESISFVGYLDVNRNIKDEFVPNESLSMEFVDAACSCLRFAHDRPDILGLLPKDDIQVLIEDGAPFLFKNALETERKMRSFLQGDEPNEATTVDLMKYILSYASNPIIHPERNINDATESSARNLLKEMANYNSRAPTFNGEGEDEQTPRNLEPNGTMKKGDWICPKCSLMNYAKNNKCVECKEIRPQRKLTGREWDCPECNFFNHGRNILCLKCECRRPGEVPLRPEKQPIKSQYPNNTSDNRNSGYAPFVPLPADMFAKKSENTTTKEPQTKNSDPKASEEPVAKVETQKKDSDEEEKSEKWFNKVAELHDVNDLTSAISDDDFPEIMPMRKGENRFVVSKKKDRSLTSSTYKQQKAMEQGINNNFVPFVPFPPDYFAKKDENQQSKTPTSTDETPSSQMSLKNSSEEAKDTNVVEKTRDTENEKVRNGWEGKSLEGSAVKETDPLDMSEEAKAERWFRRVAQIKDISELSQIPDEDFPSIMPMRKGVNRFVVSKRKTPLERRLASPEYRKDFRSVNTDPMKKEGDGR